MCIIIFLVKQSAVKKTPQRVSYRRFSVFYAADCLSVFFLICCAYRVAAEQKARATYDNILRVSDDPDVNDVIRFLREREIVHFQRFGDTNRLKRSIGFMRVLRQVSLQIFHLSHTEIVRSNKYL